MGHFLKTGIVALSVLGLTGCIDNTTLPYEQSQEVPPAPAAATVVFQNECISENDCIINKNIQNLLCNSVHHAEMNQLDQAAQKLDLVKNDKLPKSLSKGEITEEQYIELDAWVADLTDLLYTDIVTYAEVEETFPFSCAGITEQTEAVGEVVEQGIVDQNPEANAFLEKVCQSIFASEDRNYAQSIWYLDEAGFIAFTLLLNRDITSDQKEQLLAWMAQISTTLVFQPQNYTALKGPLHCEIYTPEGKGGILGAIDGALGNIF